MSIEGKLLKYKTLIEEKNAVLVAVSKNHPAEKVKIAYEAGQRIFGENLVQELVEKANLLPTDIQWHLIGHLQTNKVKYIAPFIQLIHSVDSLKLLKEINKHALKNDRVIDCLLQIYIADEDTKYGLGFDEVIEILRSAEFESLKNIRICGVMGMATNGVSNTQIGIEFNELKVFFEGLKISYFKNQPHFNIISMGMSSDFEIALAEGSNMVRIGSSIFGER